MRLARAITLFAAGAATAWYLDRRRPLPAMEHAALPRPLDPLPPALEPAAPEPAAASQPPAEEAPPEPVEAEAEEETEEAGPHEEALAEPEEEEAPPDPPAAGPTRRGPPPVPGGAPLPGRQPYPPPDPAFAAPSEQPTVEQPAVERGAEPADVAAVVDDLIASGHPEGSDHAIVDAEIVEESVAPEPPDDAQIAVAVIVELGRVPGLAAGVVDVEVTDGTVWLQGEVGDPATIVEVERRVGALDGVGRLRSLLHLTGTPPPA